MYVFINLLFIYFIFIDRYRTLDVKNILLETVSHQIMPQMLASPLWEDLNDLLRDYLKFMDDYLRESADLTFLAYRHRNYSKVSSSFHSCLFTFANGDTICSTPGSFALFLFMLSVFAGCCTVFFPLYMKVLL